MTRCGMVRGLEVWRDAATSCYWLRVPVGRGGAGPVHDLHRRVCLGRHASFEEAADAARRVMGS